MDGLLGILFGLKTHAIFDFWSIEHVIAGLSVGHIVSARNRRALDGAGMKNASLPSHFDILGVLFVAYLWEAVEHYLETGLLGAGIEHWFYGVEFWGNRLIADPLLLVMGYVIAKRSPKLIIPARIFSAAWVFVHVFLFPHSMYLNTLLGAN